MYKPVRRPLEHLMKHEDDVSGPASDFARTVYRCLFRSSQQFSEVYQCSGYWADGYVKTLDGERIPFEIKDTLGWGPLCEALVQVVSISSALKLNAKRGWVIFQSYSTAWAKNPAGAMNHATRCASEFHVGIDIYFVQFGPDSIPLS